FLYELDSFLVGSGVDVESYMTECGLSQFELTTNIAEGIRAADMAFNVKEAVKEICAQNNQIATFMSKPLPDENGNGLHYNHSVFNLAGHNAFYNPEADDNLSDVARYWIAGLITHAGALTAICSPTVNCYRRLHQPWAPDCADWGIEDRFTSFRMKAKTEKQTYIENRLPGGSANPYLVVAATVAAGMDGVMRKLKCPGQKASNAKAALLPDSLAQELQDDRVMVEALGEQFVSWFVKVKTEVELEKLKAVDLT
ncbi:Glutamine synthetase, partial [Lamellibrachia satsuma]